MLGVSVNEFYSLTLLDIQDILKAQERKIEYDRRKNYENSLVLTTLISGAFNSDVVSYDKLFNKTEIVDESWKIQRDQFSSFAESHNRKRGD